jgi:hypothetical protein
MCTNSGSPAPGKASGTGIGYSCFLSRREGDKIFFEYAYPKPNRDNISEKELKNSNLWHYGKVKTCINR